MSQAANVTSLFQTAHDDGILSKTSMKALSINDLGTQIQAGLGASVNAIQSSEVVLVTMMIDDSGSIRFGGNSEAVREGHNQVIDALLASKQNYNILVHTCYLNGQVLFPYLPLAVIDDDERERTGKIVYKQNPRIEKMTSANYNPNKGTPLYDQSVVLLGRVLAKYQEFADGGVAARTVTLIITDGADEHSTRANAKTVRSLVSDLLSENHIVAGMGIENNYVNFRQVFQEMGIQDEWILTVDANPHDIRNAFQVFSQSAVRASQGAVGFAQTAMGGFGAP